MSEGRERVDFDTLLRFAAALVEIAGGLVTIPQGPLGRASGKTLWWSENSDGSESIWVADANEERQ